MLMYTKWGYTSEIENANILSLKEKNFLKGQKAKRLRNRLSEDYIQKDYHF